MDTLIIVGAIIVLILCISGAIYFTMKNKKSKSSGNNSAKTNPTSSAGNLIDGNSYLIQNVASGQYIVLNASQYDPPPSVLANTTSEQNSATSFKFSKSSSSFSPNFGTTNQLGYPEHTANLFTSSEGKYLLFNIIPQQNGLYSYTALNTNNSYNQVISGKQANIGTYRDVFENLLKTNPEEYQVQVI